MNLTKHKGSF